MRGNEYFRYSENCSIKQTAYLLGDISVGRVEFPPDSEFLAVSGFQSKSYNEFPTILSTIRNITLIRKTQVSNDEAL